MNQDAAPRWARYGILGLVLVVGALLGVAGTLLLQGRTPQQSSVALEEQGEGLWAGLVECKEDSITFDIQNERDWPTLVMARAQAEGGPNQRTLFRLDWRIDAQPGLSRITLKIGDGTQQGESVIIRERDRLTCREIGIGYP